MVKAAGEAVREAKEVVAKAARVEAKEAARGEGALFLEAVGAGGGVLNPAFLMELAREFYFPLGKKKPLPRQQTVIMDRTSNYTRSYIQCVILIHLVCVCFILLPIAQSPNGCDV